MSLALEWKENARPVRGVERRLLEKEEQHRRNNLARSRRMRLTFTCFIIVAAAISGLLILTVFLHVMVVQNEMKVRDVEHEIELQRRQQEEIRVEIASLESPARVESIAVEQLKMVQVTQTEYLETPAYQTAKAREQEKLTQEEAMVTDATQGGQ